jgi:hypothetical protein
MALIAIGPALLREAAELRQGGERRAAVELERGGVRGCCGKTVRRTHGPLNPDPN